MKQIFAKCIAIVYMASLCSCALLPKVDESAYLGKWKGTYIQGESYEYPMVITISLKETNELTSVIEWPKWDCSTRGGDFSITQKDEGWNAAKCISWTELDHIKKKRNIVLHGRYIANLVNDNELKGIYIRAWSLKQGGTFSLSKVQD